MHPWGIDIDQQTGTLYIADCGNHKIRKITPDGTLVLFFFYWTDYDVGKVTTIAGTGSQGFADGKYKYAEHGH